MIRQGNSILCPPLFDGTNYSYWKVMMRTFIKSIDERVWQSVVTGWSPPTIKGANGKAFIKPEIDWTIDEARISGYNSKALYTIFCAVDVNQFRLISTCTTAKEAWDILEIVQEENKRDRRFKWQMVNTQFANLQMDENETVSAFVAKLCDIANQAFALGKPYSDEELVDKVLSSLPKRFSDKVVAIEECRDTSTLKLDELFVSLQWYEMRLAEYDKRKGVALQIESGQSTETEEPVFEMIDELALVIENFGKFLKKVGKKKGQLKALEKKGITWSDGESDEEEDGEE